MNTEKLKPIGDCLFDERGLVIDKSGNINSSIVGVIKDITDNSLTLLKSEKDEVAIEVVFDKTVLLIQKNKEESMTAASFNETKK